MAAAKKVQRKPTARRSRKPGEARGPEPKASRLEVGDKEVATIAARVEKEGGTVLGAYRDPFA
ncbi:MAG: hypothetical protein M3077_04775, partial [Candidatus Dormibacteraeota bacterium]|nr:hypothetical protein [Candidatus Dormibacteraeota bacterium]